MWKGDGDRSASMATADARKATGVPCQTCPEVATAAAGVPRLAHSLLLVRVGEDTEVVVGTLLDGGLFRVDPGQ